MGKQIVTIITGCGGMDGSILTEKLLEKGHKIIGIDKWRPEGFYINLENVVDDPNFILETGDITEKEFMARMIQSYKPDYFYNLAAVSLVPESFRIPHRVFQVNTLAVLDTLELLRAYSPITRFYQASSSEQIGKNEEDNQDTDSRMIPNSPYAITKLASYHLTRLYREAYNMFCVNGLLWNHEGTRRGQTFVTRKISKAVANIAKGKISKVSLGNLDAKRDWGCAEDFVDAMILMMETDIPDDYAVATGETHSIREFVEEAFKHIGMDIVWEGKDLDEVGRDSKTGIIRVDVNSLYYRPAEVRKLNGDSTKINKLLGWTPTTKFKELVKMMVEHDLND